MEENNKPKSGSGKIIAIVVVLAVVSYLFYFKEYFAYSSAKDEATVASCEKYLRDYSDGSHAEEISFLHVTLSRDIVVVRDYLEYYPESENADAVNDIKHELWDAEIARYDSVVAASAEFDPKASEFFTNLLHYMKDENIESIGVKLEGDIGVKDFSKYDEEIITLLDAFYESEDGRNVSDNITEIEKHYEQGSITEYERIICKSIEESFESILSENFISVESDSYDHHKLVININYHIENEEDEYGDPSIWTYVSYEQGPSGGEDDYVETFGAYIIGVAIEFDFSMEIPNDSEQDYSFHYTTNALDNIDDIDNIEEGYSKMTSQNFHYFGEAISTKFGINKKLSLCECNDLFNDLNDKINAGSDEEQLLEDYYFEVQECRDVFGALPEGTDVDEYAAANCP